MWDRRRERRGRCENPEKVFTSGGGRNVDLWGGQGGDKCDAALRGLYLKDGLHGALCNQHFFSDFFLTASR